MCVGCATGWHDTLKNKKRKLLAQSCPTLCYPMDYSLPSSSVHGILQQDYWNGLPFPSLGDLPDLGIKFMSLAPSELANGFFTTAPPKKLKTSLGYPMSDPGISVWKLQYFLQHTCFTSHFFPV